MPTIKYKKKIMKVSDDDLRGIQYALSVGSQSVDVQVPSGKGNFKVVWLDLKDIEID